MRILPCKPHASGTYTPPSPTSTHARMHARTRAARGRRSRPSCRPRTSRRSRRPSRRPFRGSSCVSFSSCVFLCAGDVPTVFHCVIPRGSSCVSFSSFVFCVRVTRPRCVTAQCRASPARVAAHNRAGAPHNTRYTPPPATAPTSSPRKRSLSTTRPSWSRWRRPSCSACTPQVFLV